MKFIHDGENGLGMDPQKVVIRIPIDGYNEEEEKVGEGIIEIDNHFSHSHSLPQILAYRLMAAYQSEVLGVSLYGFAQNMLEVVAFPALKSANHLFGVKSKSHVAALVVESPDALTKLFEEIDSHLKPSTLSFLWTIGTIQQVVLY